MNQEQLLGLARNMVAFLGGIAVSRGWLTSEQLVQLGGIIVLVIPLVWTWYAHTKINTVAVVAAMPEVAKVEMLPTQEGHAIAAAVGSTPDAVVTVAPQVVV